MSNKKQEALAEALREMRSFVNTPPPRGAWLELADRIEGLVREILQPGFPWKDICAKCRDGDIEPTFCAYYSEPNGCNSYIVGVHPTVEESSAVGNAAAMREALGDVLEKIDRWRTNGVMEHWQYSQLFDIADSALAAPPRNCDLGAVEEQIQRHIKWCESRANVCLVPKADKCKACFTKWAQMPYEAGEGGAK